MNKPDNKEKELQILHHIQKNTTPLRQRDIAELANLSLGMTNVILKRLAEKGWLKVQHINRRKVKYAVTPEGAAEIAGRSKRLLKRTLKTISYYRDSVDAYVAQCAAQGYRTICLTEKTEADFIVEWACARHGLGFTYKSLPADSAEIVFSPEHQLGILS